MKKENIDIKKRDIYNNFLYLLKIIYLLRKSLFVKRLT